MRAYQWLLLSLTCYIASIRADSPPVSVNVDATSSGDTFIHKWKRSFGSGHAQLTLRDDWRSHLKQAVNDLGMMTLGFRYHGMILIFDLSLYTGMTGVRYHGMFDDDMGPVVMRDDTGRFIYNWTLIDSTWDELLSNEVRPIIIGLENSHPLNCTHP